MPQSENEDASSSSRIDHKKYLKKTVRGLGVRNYLTRIQTNFEVVSFLSR